MKKIEPRHCHAPHLVGYTKIHKDEIPLGGVVSFTGALYEKTSKEFIPILRATQGRSGLYIKNAREIKETIKG